MGAIDRCVPGVVRPHRLDRVADEFEADRIGFARREDVHDAAADGELALLVGGIFAAESGVHEQFGEVGRRDVLSRLQIERRGEHALRRRDAGQQRRCRRDQHARGATGNGVQGAGADGRDADVRRHPAIGIHFMRGERQDRALGGDRRQPFERRQEKGDVGAGLLEVSIAGNDVEDEPVRTCMRGAGDKQRLGGVGKPGHEALPGTSIPLREMAVLSTARRLSEVEVEVVTGVAANPNVECNKRREAGSL